MMMVNRTRSMSQRLHPLQGRSGRLFGAKLGMDIDLQIGQI